MDFNDLIHSRESIRSYDPSRPVPMDVLTRILEAGRLAPSAANIQPWRFILISSPEMLGKIRLCYHREWFRKAPHVLVVAGDKARAWKRSSDGYNSIETDLAIALTHIILAAENEGVGTCWIANYDPLQLSHAGILKEGEVVFGITPMGYPEPGFKKGSAKNRKGMGEVVEFI
jgi:nitroreductase